jgi:hypothetical protein
MSVSVRQSAPLIGGSVSTAGPARDTSSREYAEAMPLDPEKLPPVAVPLITMAERWGIGDDCDRDDAVYAASADELEALARCLDGIDASFGAWLAGSEAESARPSAEYLAMTCLTMASDLARVILEQHERDSPLGR